ncbi:tyrosine-protein phosphatase [Persicitalea jodogahamensis]|uniref:protein-tyrosine-phosphatase n=1 Tax=Persicitalea jodogahamensis TaxID=402147 RepID=A0A8J3G881_9BACT|nr:CpsB/CapC family capsule biosynthesis tyrosine phosphatase [Persicitalea jodogahamensis]GHB62867.1 capsular polysaccharide biosynthesis protein [Persicitalea jodogahamensis]
MLNWLFKTPSLPLDLSFLGADMHSHLLPGIDDGVGDAQEAVAMIRQMKAYGYHHLITTPHIIWDCYRNTPATIAEGLQTVRAACAEAGLDIQLDAAAEYFLDEHFSELLSAGEPLLTLPGKRVLVELPYTTPLMNTPEILFSIIGHGYQPVLAHPERYAYYHADPTIFQKLSDQGCELQLNALSLTGHYGEGVTRTAEWLLKHRLVTFLGSDAHRISHVEQLKKLTKRKDLKDYPFQNYKLSPKGI